MPEFSGPTGKKHLVVLKLAAIGDVTMAARALALNSRALAAWHITWIIDAGLVALAQKLIAPHGLSVSFAPLDAGALMGVKGFAGRRQALAALWRTLRAASPQAVALLHRDWRYRLLCRIAAPGAAVHGLTTGRRSEAEALSSCVSSAIGAVGFEAPAGHATKPTGGKHRIGLLVGGGKNQKVEYKEKTWPHFAELAHLLSSDSRFDVTLFGSPDDAATAREVEARAPSVTNCVGAVALADLPAALAELDALISVDTGPAHMAAHMFTSPHQRCFVLFGPTDHRVWAPRATHGAKVVALSLNLECAPCYHDDGHFKPCRFIEGTAAHRRCLSAITAGQVYSTLVESCASGS